MREDIDRWDEKYRGAKQIILPKAEAELETFLESTPVKGLAAEIACGKGAQALWLAARGMEVFAVDASIQALVHCKYAAEKSELPVYPVVMDLDRCGFPSNRFALITIVRYLNRELVPQLISSLAPGGILFYKTFNLKHLEARPKFNPNFVLQVGELQKLFSSLEILCLDEHGPTSYLIGRKS